MNEPAKTFGETHSVAFKVVMCDSTNDNLPTIELKVVPVGTAPEEVMTVGKPLLDIRFGSEDSAAIKFYEPDGSAFLDLSVDEEIPHGTDINGHMNQAWTGNADDLFMQAVQTSVGQIVSLVDAAEVAVEASEEPLNPQEVFDTLRAESMPRLVDVAPAKTALDA